MINFILLYLLFYRLKALKNSIGFEGLFFIPGGKLVNKDPFDRFLYSFY